jgi:hypothetical protein
MPIPIRLAAIGPLMTSGLDLIRDLELHQLPEDAFRQGTQEVLPALLSKRVPECHDPATL